MDISNSAVSSPPIMPSDRLVYLVSDDNNFASHLSQQILHFGYRIQHVRDIKSLPNIIAEQKSVAVTIDIPASQKQPTDQDIFVEINSLKHTYSNLIFTSDRDDQIVRLKSIQAGGAAFFNKPINIVSLIDKLDSLNKNTKIKY